MTSATSEAVTATGARSTKPRRTTTRGVSTLMYASQQGDVDRVRRILGEQPETLLTRDRTGKTPLHYCCTSDNICAAQAADLLVMAAPDLVESHDEDGFTPLHLAVIAGNMPLVTFLLANNADVNAVDNEKHTVVHWATVCGETAALRAVLAAGAPVSTPDVHGGYPLHYAAQMCGGDKDSNLGFQVLQTLLTHSDIVVSVEDGDGRQPLLWAASAGSAKALLALVRAGAAVESSDKDGLTALHCAASRGHTDCIDSLLTLCGASPDVIDSNGCTALHYAVTLGHADATALLLAHGADPNRQDRKGRTPAHCGCAKGQFETVKMIGAHGANLWLRNARGDLPLHEAAASGRRDLVRWLLDMRPSQVNARNNDGRCPLHLAALNDNADMCKILLDAGAQINPILRTSKNTFMTPLDCALQRGFRSTAKYLQLHGGVPATRLGDVRHNQVNTGVLQIKEDVTFWGDTSTDSERENGEVTKHSRRIQRKKLTHKYEKKKASISESDLENSRLISGRKRRLSEKNQKLKTAGKTNSANVSIDSAKYDKRKAASSQFDYKNEIIINGKTEINIHQTKEIHMVPNEENLDKVPSKLSAEVPNVVTAEKEKRPKSAKHAKVKESSAKQKPKVERPISKKKQNGSQKSENEIKAKSLESTKIVKEGKKLSDQQSLTSEDQEEHRNLVVEAAVHEPPKTTEESNVEKDLPEEEVPQVAESEKISTEVKQEETHKTETAKNDKKMSENEIKAEPLKEKQETETIIKPKEDIQLSEVQKTEMETKIAEPLKEKQETQKTETADQPKEDNQLSEVQKTETETKIAEPLKEKQETETAGKPKEEIQPSEVQKTEMETKIEELGDPAVIVKETTEDVAIPDASPKVEKDTEKTEAQTEKSTENKVLEEKTVTEEVDENNIKTTIVVDSKKEEPEKLATEEKKVDTNKNDKTSNNIESNIDNQISNHVETNKIQKTKSQKQKTKTKRQHKKRHSKDDQAYEIIYKTMGAEENGDVALEHLNDADSKTKAKRETLKPQKTISGSKSSEEESSTSDTESSTSTSLTVKEHKSFRILNDKEAEEIKSTKTISRKSQRSRSEETKKPKNESMKKSKIPTSKSDKHLNIPERKIKSSMDSRVPSLPNINKEHQRCDSNMSAPLPASVNSDNEKASASDLEEEEKESATRRRKVRRRTKRDARSAGSDYESSNVIDSGFEPSPRSNRIPKWKNMSERGVNMTSVTQSIQSNIRRYHLERKIFQQLLELKRMQIRAGQHNEAILVKRAIDSYHQSCASTVGAGRYVPEDYTFKSFEKFLYLSLRKLQRNGADHLKGLPESSTNPLLCTQSTHRCMHATHAYTGIPCAAYLPKMDHHTIPKIGFTSTQCKPGTGFLPTINQKKAVTLELCHGNDKQVISLPADRLDQNKRYYVTFTVKGAESSPPKEETSSHRHSKSD